MVGAYADDGGVRGDLIATYEYDGLGRRIQRTVSGTTYDTYLSESWQEVETRKNGDVDALDKYVYDIRYIDAVVVRMHDGNTDGDYDDTTGNVDSTLYYTQDANYNTMSVILTTGVIMNRYAYTPNGSVTTMDANFSTNNVVDSGNNRLYQSVTFDLETKWYYHRNRYRDINFSWTQRDPNPEGAYADGMSFYGFVNGRVIVTNDPDGLLTVYIWEDNILKASFGHTSITLDDGTYISWWPVKRAIISDAVKDRKYDDDVIDEGRKPDWNIMINELCEEIIAKWWAIFKSNQGNKWELLGNSCAGVIYNALNIGGGSDMPEQIWSPIHILYYAQEIYNYEHVYDK